MEPLPPSAVLAQAIADEPRYVDVRGLLLSGRCAVVRARDPEHGLIARSWDFPFAAGVGELDEEVVRRVVADGELPSREQIESGERAEWHLLVQPEAAETAARALPGWDRRAVHIHRYERELPAFPADPEGAELTLAPDGWAAAGFDLGHLPPDLRREMENEYVASRPLAAAFVDGRLAATCYAPFVTEALWDVAVDTLEPHRRRGLASACFLALAAHLGRSGRRPVWGAVDENTASLRLAARLGFRPDAELISLVHRP